MGEVKRDFSELDTRFTEFFDSQERVEVTWKPGFGDYTGYGARSDGHKARFYVGRSTGWKPIYIMLLRRDSICGGSILSDCIESIRGLGIYRTQRRWKHGRRGQ